MGAFVGNVTSPFFKRRKGRIGKDVWIEKIAPIYAGAEIKMAVGNHQALICCPNFAVDYQYNLTGGNDAWISVALPAGGHIGENPAFKCVMGSVRPVINDYVADKGIFYAAGLDLGALTGAIFRINSTPFANAKIANVPGQAWQQSIVWTEDGRFFCTVGTATPGTMTCRGGDNPDNPETVILTRLDSGSSVHAIEDPSVPYPHFIISGAGGAAFSHIHRVNTNDWRGLDGSQNAANPDPGLIVFKWLQYRNLVIGIGDQPNGVRSIDYGKLFVSNAINGVGSTQRAIWRRGNRFFIASSANPKIRTSTNFGFTWNDALIQLPSATAIPNSMAEHLEHHYLFCNDGGINRVYIHKPYTDI